MHSANETYCDFKDVWYKIKTSRHFFFFFSLVLPYANFRYCQFWNANADWMWMYNQFAYSERAQLLKDPKQPSQSWHSVNFNMNRDIMICNHRGPVRLFHCVSCLSKLCIEGWQNFELLCYFQGQPYALTWILIISLWGFIFYCSDIVVTSHIHPHPWYPLLTKEKLSGGQRAVLIAAWGWVQMAGPWRVHGRGLRQPCSTSCPQIIPRHLTLERISQLKCRLAYAYKSMAISSFFSLQPRLWFALTMVSLHKFGHMNHNFTRNCTLKAETDKCIWHLW